MIAVIDNYDSFVFNIARYLRELGAESEVIRNDRITVEELIRMKPRAILISPGPCTPTEAGISMSLVRELSGRVPILGICLGHQCIGSVFGGRVVRSRHPMHGQASLLTHSGQELFKMLPSPLRVGRYHSLVVELDDASQAPLTVAARSEEGEIMALGHRHFPTFGVQFHPESILSEHGHALLANFLGLAERWNETCDLGRS